LSQTQLSFKFLICFSFPNITILQAKDIDAVKALVADHPHLMMHKASLEILEIMPMTA
jgi:hypothetical protein